MALRKAGIVLGAGASRDAGLPDAYGLTKLVYNNLLERPRAKEASHLYGYTLSKLIERNVRAGGSPFADINVEDVYDGLYKLLYRDKDLISDFVYSWDPILESMKPKFSRNGFESAMEKILVVKRNLSGSTTYNIDKRHVKEAARQIGIAINNEFSSSLAPQYLSIFVGALVDCLSNPTDDNPYIDELVKFAAASGSPIATLNYDLLIEKSCGTNNIEFDTGLSEWKDRKIVNWNQRKLKLLKMHGSIDWRGESDDIQPVDQQMNAGHLPYALVFGGHNSKLVPHGPFLQIRHDFETSISRLNTLLVIGYSFRDDHLNALIRRWVSTREKAKLIVVDPGTPSLDRRIIGFPYRRVDDFIHQTVEIQHIPKKAKDGIAEALDSCRKRPKLEPPKPNNAINLWAPR